MNTRTYNKGKLIITVLAMLVACIGSLFAFSPMHSPIAPVTGDVLAVHSGTVIKGIEYALAGRSGTSIMGKGDYLMFVWNIRDGFAFVALDTANKVPIMTTNEILAHGGNFVNCATMGCLRDFLVANGWKAVAPAAVPDVIRIAIVTANSWLMSLSTSMVTFVVVPVGVYDVTDIYPTGKG